MREGLVVASCGLYFPIAADNQCFVRKREVMRAEIRIMDSGG
jgi:hypothetical protein